MSKVVKKVLLVLMALMLAIPVLPTVEAQASTKKPAFPSKITMAHYKKGAWNGESLNRSFMRVGNDKTGRVDISKVKSSNPKVLRAVQGADPGYIVLETKKAGTSKVTFEAKVGKKKYKYTSTVKVVKYENPLKTFKVGSKNYLSKLKSTSVPRMVGAPVKGKLNIAAKKGWKITSMEVYESHTGKRRKIKNKANINLEGTGGVSHLSVTVKNSKTGMVQYLLISRG